MKNLARSLISLLLAFFSGVVTAETLQLSCDGTETELNSISGNSSVKNTSKSYFIENRKIGNMDCTVWTDRVIYCTGVGTIRKADGSNREISRTTINVQFDRLSGSVKEVVDSNMIVEIDAVSSNPFGFGTYKKEVNVKSRTVFEGVCTRASRKF
jgi:hypothetical protein